MPAWLYAWAEENIGVVQPINTGCHSLLIVKLIVMIMIINIIFVSEWHFALCCAVLLAFYLSERQDDVPSKNGDTNE